MRTEEAYAPRCICIDLINLQVRTFNRLKLIASHQHASYFEQNLDATGVERIR